MNLPAQPPLLRKPPWLKVRPPYAEGQAKVRRLMSTLGLHTVCQEACCPNIAECFSSGTATFLILGNICTRNCRYCNIASGVPAPPDPDEIAHLLDAVGRLNLQYVVLTSVTRDDLPDGGATRFADCIDALRRDRPDRKVEVLIPDFQGKADALQKVIDAGPDVINHNIEVVSSLFPKLRPEGNYARSLSLLAAVAQTPVIAKSGFMVGLGESDEDLLRLLDDLAATGCQRLTIGQYQQPTLSHWPVTRYLSPEDFDHLGRIAREKGILEVIAGPLVRSSYRAASSGQAAKRT